MKAPAWAGTGSDEDDSLWVSLPALLAIPAVYKNDQDTIIADWAVEAHAGKGNPAETLLCPAQWAGRLTWPATFHAITSSIARGGGPRRRPGSGGRSRAMARQRRCRWVRNKSCQRR